MSLPTPGWNVVYGEQPTAAKWSQLGANDDALAAGTGLNSRALPADRLAGLKAYTGSLSGTTSTTAPIAAATISISPTDVPGANSWGLLIWANGRIQNNAANQVKDLSIGFRKDGGSVQSTNVETATNGRWFVSTGSTDLLTLTPATSHTVDVMAQFGDLAYSIGGKYSALLVPLA